ncbi:MAG: hypothetical protein JXR56_05445 [Candidatus Cloacimonetes bacterium]|nr:hypothetical protein [Candidatus Cloacimonadota bacterium]
MKRVGFILIGSFLLLFLLSCGQSPPLEVYNPTQMIVPVHEGNYWAVWNSYLSRVDTLRYIPRGDGWYYVCWNNSSSSDYFAKYTNEGLVYYIENGTKAPIDILGRRDFNSSSFAKSILQSKSITYLLAKYPIRRGEKWLLFGNIMITDEENFGPSDAYVDFYLTCINKAVNVDTPAGSFDCVVYEMSWEYHGAENPYPEAQRFYYYAPGVGCILSNYRNNEQDELIIDYELVDYHIEPIVKREYTFITK